MENANEFIVAAAAAGFGTVLIEYFRTGGHVNWRRVSRRARENAIIVGTVAVLIRQQRSAERPRRGEERLIRL